MAVKAINGRVWSQQWLRYALGVECVVLKFCVQSPQTAIIRLFNSKPATPYLAPKNAFLRLSTLRPCYSSLGKGIIGTAQGCGGSR